MDLKILFLLGVLTSGLPAEPPEQYLIAEYINGSTGLLIKEYAVLSKTVNYITARQILFSTHEGVETVEYPLFYWFDWNGDSVFSEGEMYVDTEVKGCGCDVREYHSLGMDGY